MCGRREEGREGFEVTAESGEGEKKGFLNYACLTEEVGVQTENVR